MSPLQQDIFDEFVSYAWSTLDVLERHELRLRDFESVKADANDPYSINVCDVADEIYRVRDDLADALELAKAFYKNDGSGVAAK